MFDQPLMEHKSKRISVIKIFITWLVTNVWKMYHIFKKNILYHKGLGSARRMLCSDLWHRTVLPTEFTPGYKALHLTLKVGSACSSKYRQLLSDCTTFSSRSQHHLNHNCVTLKFRWQFKSTNLEYNFRNKVFFF